MTLEFNQYNRIALEPSDHGKLSLHVDTSTLETMRHLLGQLKNDLQDDVWHVLEDLAWNLYRRYRESLDRIP